MDFAFLHGGGQGSWVWRQTIAALCQQATCRDLRVLALDVPGCGLKRDRITSGLTLQAIAEELVRDIETAGMRDVVLVGHSQAGSVMPLMAGAKPDLFRRFVHLTCSIPLQGQTVQQMLGTGVQGTNLHEVGWPVDPQATRLEERYDIMFCNDMDATTGQSFRSELGHDHWPMSSYLFDDWDHDLHRAVSSTFVICLRDAVLPVAWQEVFAQRFVAECMVRIDAGHQAMITRPHALAEILLHEGGGL